MMRWRFSSGVVLGLALGMPLGALLVILAIPSRTTSSAPPVTVQQLDDLGRRLESAQENAGRPLRDKLDELTRQLGQTGEANAALQAQVVKTDEMLRATQARLEAVEQRLNRPVQPSAPAGQWDQ